MRLVNCTPHAVCFYSGSEQRLTLEPSGIVTRVAMGTALVTSLVVRGDDGYSVVVPIMATVAGPVEDLPAPAPDTYYVVSRLVLDHAPDRGDLVVPHDLVRDDEGRILGCQSFSR